MKTDLRPQEMQKELKELADNDDMDNDCLICSCILIHRDDNYLCGTGRSGDWYLLTDIYFI